ncbi:hypothetical protein QOZ88_05265 [Blastococcus sp. BMG 814]|uniref:Lipoprotein n=1 Tax=Blastococcus carthaginiensis TaxID=3050034 RepID=A0ABT9I8Z0_9ACTN|nr:hypothetical protein [Blastococcus carthaginiensis]MDP5182039.1 hypothetical protein [Blastococcus carthaginiensis]
MRARALPIALTAALLTGACTSSPDEGSDPEEQVAQIVTAAPGDRLTLVADEDPVAMAASASRTFFDEAGVVVLVAEDDPAGTLLGASAAVALGVPLLVGADGSGVDEPVLAELERLGTTTVLAVGDAAPAPAAASSSSSAASSSPAEIDAEVIGVPADPAAVAAVLDQELAEADPVAEGGEVAAVAALDPAEPVALRPEGGRGGAAEESSTEEDGEADAEGSLPEIEGAEPLEGTLVMTTGTPDALAAAATARAAGARVLVTGGTTDPRASQELISTLAEDDAEHVVALGAGFGAEEGLDWKLATAATGTQLPGGGQVLFPGRMMVALYGHPETGALGVLGEQPVDAAIQRARDHAAPYEQLVDATVVPTFEIIATVASASAGPDGNYSAEGDVEMLRPWVEAAGDAGLYVILDLQPGRTDFVTQAELYRPLLELPYVGLALDPEWRLGPNEVHLVQIGSVGIEEVNRVVTWLADLTRENELPQKLLVLHQFRVDMIPGLEQLDTSRDELAIMVHVDGQGGQGAKQATWQVLHRNAPEGLFWGWKNFYDEDIPMLTPGQTIEQVDPLPELVTYQ